MISFSLSDVRAMCEPSTFSVGYDKNEAGLSTIKSSSKISDEMMMFTAVTQGKKLYKQSVNVYVQEEGIKIIGKCNCEVGRNCKHVVSAALAYLDEETPQKVTAPLLKPAKQKSTSSWMDEFAQSFASESNVRSSSTVLLYEITHTSKLDAIEMVLYTARELKDGGYGKVNRARPTNLFNISNPPDYLQEDDKEVILLFKNLAMGSKTQAVLTGRLGAMILEGALKTKRCFWKRSHKVPLFLSHSRTLKLAWKSDEDKSRLEYEVGDKSFVLPLEPLFYIDTKSKEVGELDTELNAKQITLIEKAPSYTPEELQNAVVELSERLPKLEVEVPDEIGFEPLEILPTKARLVLQFKAGQYRISPFVMYDDHLCTLLPFVSKQMLSDKKKVLYRDETAEARFIELLEGYGFVQEGKHFQAKALRSWKQLLEDEEELKEQGCELAREKGFALRFEQVHEVNVQVEQNSYWFDMKMHININGQQVPLLPIISRLLSEGIDLDQGDEHYFEVEPGQYIAVQREILEPIIKTFYELLDTPNSEGFVLKKFEAQTIEHFNSPHFSLHDKSELSQIAKELKTPATPLALKTAGLQAELRPYQAQGVSWMQFLRRYGFGGILADDMGLGKTLQTLAHLLIEKEQDRLTSPALIVVPTSLLGNWMNEAKKFTPSLGCAQYYGNERENVLDNINSYDIIVTSYTILSRDINKLQNISFYYLILDEAQKIKNATSQWSKATRMVKRKYALALSGTPMENHLGELHTLFDTVMNGFLGTSAYFKTHYQKPIEKNNCIKTREALSARVAPFMLRRTKEKVAKELPPKTEVIRSVQFESDQARLYETIRLSMEKSVRESIKSLGLAKSHISILSALLKLRQVCCDPRLIKIDEAQKIAHSAKLEMLLELLEELLEEKRRVLIFSQFTTMLDIIEASLNERKIAFAKLTGATQNRQKQIDTFEGGEADVFLISLKAGGVGLNLTSADTVIHYDPWWNPAAEDQATDRAYRIGQDKPVFVYKLIVENSVEEKIIAMQGSKKELANAIYEGKEEGFEKLDEKTLLELFS